MAGVCLNQNSFEAYSDTEPVVEEIEEDQGIALTLGKHKHNAYPSPSSEQKSPQRTSTSMSPPKAKRDFGNISPISELLFDDSPIIPLAEETEDGVRNFSPEPETFAVLDFRRISDGRSSPILAFSPSLVKSPSSNKPTARTSVTSPSGGGAVGKRPRNIARMLDNISDHSSGEEEVNSVGVMMAKFTV